MNAEALQRRLYSTLSGAWSSLSRSYDYVWVEAAVSPAKYALFQVLGYYFIRTTGQFDVPPGITASYAARIGCSAGIALGAFYCSLLLWRSHTRYENVPDLGTYAALSNPGKEMAYSSLASLGSAFLHGHDDRVGLFILAISGSLGPVVFLAILFGLLGVVIVVAWIFERFRHQQAQQ